MNPNVSIIIPTYNTEKYLENCVMSCLDQYYQDYEIIIVDDGSTDNTQEIIKKLQTKHPDKIVNLKKKNGGTASALNTGMRHAKGKWLKWLSADDRLYPMAISHMMGMIENRLFTKTSKILFYTDYDFIDSDGIVTGKFEEPNRSKMTQEERGAELFFNFYGNGTTSIFSKEAFEIVGGFDELIPYIEDLDFWLKWTLEHKFDIEHLPITSAQYRIHPKSLTSKKDFSENEKVKQMIKSRYEKYLTDYQKHYIKHLEKSKSLKRKIISKMPNSMINLGLKWKKRK